MADPKKATGGNRFSVYAGLGDTPELNWSKVATTLSEGLKTVRDQKMLERKTLEDATSKAMENLNKVTDVNNRSLGKVVIEASNESKEELRIQMDLVRRGVLRPTDYKLFMQEQKNGYSSFGNIVKTYDKWFTEAKEKVVAGTATNLHIQTMKQIESFGNLNNKKIYTNPVNGQLQVVTMEQDAQGKYVKMPNAKKSPDSYNNPNSILGLMAYDGGEKVDLDVETKKITDNLATIINTSISNGSVTSYEDFRQAFNDPERLKSLGIATKDITTFDQFLNSQADVFVTSDADVLEILTENGIYQIEDKNKENYIKIDYSGDQPKIDFGDADASEAKRLEARDIVKQLINQQIDSKETSTRPFDNNTPAKLKNKGDAKKGASTVSALNRLRGATTQEDLNLAVTELQGISGLTFNSVEEIKKMLDGKEIVTGVTLDLNGRLIEIPFGVIKKDETGKDVFNPTGAEEFVQSTYSYFNRDGVPVGDALVEFNRKGTLIEDVNTTTIGGREKKYKTKGTVTLNQTYSSSGDETTLKDQLAATFENSYNRGRDNDLELMASGTEQAISEAYAAAKLDLPEGFSVTVSDDDKNLVISRIDNEGIAVKQLVTGVNRAGRGDANFLTAAVQKYLNDIK